MDTMLEKVKVAMRITTNAFDDELADLIQACLLDLGIGGVVERDLDNFLIRRAVITYCRLHFGTTEDFELLKKAYDEQKAQMSMATGYTDWNNG